MAEPNRTLLISNVKRVDGRKWKSFSPSERWPQRCGSLTLTIEPCGVSVVIGSTGRTVCRMTKRTPSIFSLDPNSKCRGRDYRKASAQSPARERGDEDKIQKRNKLGSNRERGQPARLGRAFLVPGMSGTIIDPTNALLFADTFDSVCQSSGASVEERAASC
jgi:hypothetical protein